MNENLIDIRSLFPEEIEKIISESGFEKYRAKQIFSWLGRCVSSFDEMTDISKKMRDKLKSIFYISNMLSSDKLISKIDGTRKYLFTLADGEYVESVLMKYNYGYSVCLSTQVGCKMGCKFCASAKAGFSRNLSSGEILDEMAEITKDMRKTEPDFRISHIVLMGIGEPLDNYDNVIRFLRLVNHKDGFGISERNISLSTCGIIPNIKRLSEENLPVTLSVSLHAPNSDIRDTMMPINQKYPFEMLLNACRDYAEKTSRRISFEYALIKGKNDSEKCASELGKALKGMLCHVNLIPINPTKENDFSPSERASIERFINILARYGITATCRRTLGQDINAACGQLRRNKKDSSQKEKPCNTTA